MRRREFITLLSGAAATWPLGVQAQQGAGLSQAANGPLVGFLNSASPDTYRFNADSFREGLAQAGFVEGRNVRIEERWAKGDYQALPELAAELVAKGVAAIAATGDVASARAAQQAGKIPVVFTIGSDPVRFGLVASLNRPGGHVTGVSLLTSMIGAKRIELLRQVAPKVSRVGLVMNPSNPSAAAEQADAEEGARKLGLETIAINAGTRTSSTARSKNFSARKRTPFSSRPTRSCWTAANRSSLSPSVMDCRPCISCGNLLWLAGF